MAIASRTIKNKRDAHGVQTGRPGIVFDVNLKYKSADGYSTYSKKGFQTKKDALLHEAEMRTKLSNSGFLQSATEYGKQTMKEYLLDWVVRHGAVNLRPSTFAGYKSNINNHIIPHIGHVQLRQLSPAMLDQMFQKLFEKGLSSSSVKYCQRIVSVALEAARKYNYIVSNPAQNIITKFGKQGKTPDPFTIQQMQKLLTQVTGTEWEMLVVLAGLYGLRISEALGLRWASVDMEKSTFNVMEQLPYKLEPATLQLPKELPPVKSHDRVLPITEYTRPYFERQMDLQQRQRALIDVSVTPYFNNQLVVAKPNGVPFRREPVTKAFGHLLKRLELPHIRFHDLRHTAATNMHQLTGDFFTVGQILGHSLKGVGLQLGISANLDSVTAQYIDVRLDRKREVLQLYHKAILEPEPQKVIEAPKRRYPEMER